MKKFTKILTTSAFVLLVSLQTQAQKFMGVGTDKPNPRAVLELKVEDAAGFQQGFLPPRLLTLERTNITFQAAIASLKGLTVYDTDLNAYFVWNGTTWDRLAVSASSQTVVGVGGITVTTSGLTISVDGSNFVDFTELITPKDIKGSYADGFTVSGLNSISIVGVPTAANPILSFNGTNFVYAALPTSQITSITGTNGALVDGTNATGFTVNGQNFLTTTDGLSFVRTVTGINGITATSLAGGNFQIDGAGFLRTITGSGGIVVGSIAGGGFSIDGSNFAATTLLGTAGLSVLGAGSTQTVSGAGMVILQQSLVNAVGSASITALASLTVPVFKAVVRIPAGVKNISGSLNVYCLTGGSTTAGFRVQIGTLFSDLTGISSNSVDNFQPLTDIDVSSIAGTTVLVKVFANVSVAGEAAYIQGITLTVKD